MHETPSEAADFMKTDFVPYDGGPIQNGSSDTDEIPGCLESEMTV